MSLLPSSNLEDVPTYGLNDNINNVEERLNEILLEDPNETYNIREIVQRIGDKGYFL